MTTVKETFCRICEPYCPMLAEVDDQGEVTKLKPNPDHPCKGTPCNKGLSWLGVHNDPDRLNYPLKRTNSRAEDRGNFERISWDQSIAEAGEKLRAVRDKYGPDAIAVYFGNPIGFNSRFYGLVGSFCEHIQTRMVFNPLSQDFSNKSYAAGAMYGSASVWTAPDLYNTNYLLCIGGNPKVSHWTLVSVPNDNGDTLKQIKARGGKVQFVNPRKIESSTSETGDTLRIKPDTDVYLLAAMLNELNSLDAFDWSIIEKYGKNVEGLLEFATKYPAERVAPITGIDADTIRQLARDYMSADGAIVYVATGVNMGRQGTTAYWIAEMINFLTGNLGRDGGMYRPAGFCKTDLPLPEQEVSIETSVGTLSMTHNYNPMPTTVLPDLIENGDIKALVVLCGNPLLSLPAESKLRESFKKLEVMVATDIMRTDTVELCDYVYPATDWLEREDIPMFSNGSQLRPYVQYTEAVVAPKYERRADWSTMSRLALELGPSELFERELKENGFSTINLMLGASDLSIEKLSQMPHQTAMIEQPSKADFFQTDIFHKDGKIDCCPADFIEAGLLDRCEKIFKELESESPDTLKLITMRTIHMHNGWLSNVPMFRKGINNVNPLNMSETDAERLGLFDGDDIRVHNKFGSIETQVLINNELRAGAVALTHGFGHKKAYGLKVASTKAGANYNQLVPTGADTHEPRSYMCWMTGVPVEVEPLNK